MNNIKFFLKGINKCIALSRHRSWILIGLFLLIIFNASIEVINISLVQPLAALTTGSEILNLQEKSYLINKLFEIFNIYSLNINQVGVTLIITLSLSFISTIILLYASTLLSVLLRKDWSKDILSKILKSSYSSISRERTGKLVETITNETKMGGEVIFSLVQLIEKSLLSFLLIISLFISNFWPTLILIIFSFLVLLILKYVGIFNSVERGRKILKYNQSIASIIAESILNIRQIKLLNIYKYPLKNLESNLKNYGKVRVAFGVSKGIPQVFFKYLFITGGVITLIVISSRGEQGYNYLPNLSLLAVLAGRLSTVFSSLSKQIMKFNLGLANIESVYKRLFSKSNIEDLDRGIYLKRKIKKISLNNLNYAWKKNNQILKNINITFEKGVNVITGPSGCGKSTIASLILALLIPDEGEIKINDENINAINLNSLRNKIAYVTQENEFFMGTFTENIRLGNPEAKEEEIIKAAKSAMAHDFILKTKNGYNSELSERAAQLSGGQKQRISISRALIKKYDVYIFDEVTNALDQKNEMLIQKTITELGKENIVIQISHLPSSIKRADKIFEFNKKGQISERINKPKENS